MESLLLRQEKVRRRNWGVGFIRNFNDWEIDGAAAFSHLLESHIPFREGEDCMRWKPKNSGEFTVQSFYETLRGSPPMSFPWKAIWKVKAPRRVSFFIWTAALGKILTSDNLIKRGYSLLSWYCMCRRSGETVDHLLIHCSVAAELWNLYLGCLGFNGYYKRRFLIYYVGQWVADGRIKFFFKCMESCSFMFVVDYLE